MSVKKEVKQVIKHSTIYGIGMLLQKLPPFLLLPLYLNYLNPDDYGKKEIIALFIDFVSIVFTMGIANTMARFYYDYDDKKEQNKVVSTIILSFAVIAGVTLVGIGFFAEPISELIIDNPADKFLIIMALASLWFNTIYHMGCNYIRIKEKSMLFVLVSISKLILQLSLNVWFIAGLKWGIYGIFASTLISSSIFAVFLVVPLLYRIGLAYSQKIFSEIIAFGGPMIISQLMATIVNISDRYFIKAYVSIASAGIYTLGYRFGNSIHNFVNSPFQQIWNPRRFAVSKQSDAKEIYAKILTYYCILQGLVAVILITCIKDIIIIMGKPAFYNAASIAPIITIAYVLFGIEKHFNTGLLIEKKTKYFATINTANAILNLILNFLLIPNYGMYGAAWATFACMLAKFIATLYFSNRLYPIKWEYKRLIRISIAVMIACTICQFISYEDILSKYLQNYELNMKIIRWLGLKHFIIHAIVGTILFILGLFIPGFINPKEMNYLKTKLEFLKRPKNIVKKYLNFNIN